MCVHNFTAEWALSAASYLCGCCILEFWDFKTDTFKHYSLLSHSLIHWVERCDKNVEIASVYWLIKVKLILLIE